MRNSISSKKLEFIIEGKNFYNLLNIINFYKISITNCKITKNNQLKFTTSKINASKMFDLLEKSCYTFNTREKHNFEYYFSNIIGNIGLLFSLGVFTFIACLYPYYIWDIKINCDNPNLYSSIEAYLSGENIFVGTQKSFIDKNMLEYSLLQNLPQLSQASVNFDGSTLVVSVKQKVAEIFENEFSPLVSAYTGKIVSFDLISGTSLVKEGDFIKKGDILVAPYMINGEDKLVCQAQAIIGIEAYFESSVFYDEKGENLYRTGKSKTVCKLSFENMIIGNIENSPYECYEIEEKEKFISSIIPIKISYRTYYEMEYRQNLLKINEVLDQLIIECEKKIDSESKLNAERIENISQISESAYNISVAYKKLVYQNRYEE